MSNYQDGFNDGYLRAATIIMKQLSLELTHSKAANDLTAAVVKCTKLSPRRLIREHRRLYGDLLAGPFEHAVMGTYREGDRIPKPRLGDDRE